MPRLYVADHFTPTLPVIPDLEIRRFSLKAIPEDAEADGVVMRDASVEQFKTLVARMPNIRWLQVLTAGVNKPLAANLPLRVQLCNGRGVHDAPTAELGVTLLLNAARRMHHWRDLQKQSLWDAAAYDEVLYRTEPLFGTLEGSRILIIGMGTIGQEIAKRLAPFGAIIEGVAQSAGVREGYKVHAVENILSVLPDFDAVISVLPGTEETTGFIGAAFFKAMAKHAWFVNVGRGASVNEAEMVAALQKNEIAGAALDVTAVEPLPPASPLWAMENVILTPHIAGGGPRYFAKAAALVNENATRFAAGKPLLNAIDRTRGY